MDTICDPLFLVHDNSPKLAPPRTKQAWTPYLLLSSTPTRTNALGLYPWCYLQLLQRRSDCPCMRHADMTSRIELLEPPNKLDKRLYPESYATLKGTDLYRRDGCDTQTRRRSMRPSPATTFQLHAWHHLRSFLCLLSRMHSFELPLFGSSTISLVALRRNGCNPLHDDIQTPATQILQHSLTAAPPLHCTSLPYRRGLSCLLWTL